MTLLGAVVLTSALTAQPVPAAPGELRPLVVGTSAIDGRVVTPDGTPIGDVRVRLMRNEPPSGAAETITTADGRYAFNEVAGGKYRLQATHPNYVVTGTSLPGSSTQLLILGLMPLDLTIAKDTSHRDANVTMTRGAVISGRIVNESGEPMPMSTVVLVGTADKVARVMSDMTPANGVFRVVVPPGEFVLQAATYQKRDDGEYVTTYYPGVTERSEAATLRVSSGDAITGIEISLRLRTLHTLRGRVSASDGHSVPPVELTLAPLSGTVRNTHTKPDGSFVFSKLTPGHHLLSARAVTANGIEAAWQSIAIDGTHDVHLVLGPAGAVSGRVVTDSGEPVDLEHVRVGAALADGARDVDPSMRLQSEVAIDGTFAIDGVFGPRILRLIGLPSGWIMLRVLVDGIAVEAPHVTLASGVSINGIVLVISRP